MTSAYKADKAFYKKIIAGWLLQRHRQRRPAQGGLHVLNNKARYLWRQYAKIISDQDEKNANGQPLAVLDKIFTQVLEVLHAVKIIR